MARTLPPLLAASLLLLGCGDDDSSTGTTSTEASTSEDDPTETSSSETASGDGDGDPTTGDGDGDPTTGDGDGDPTTGDGDGDPTTGDGDGDPNVEFTDYETLISGYLDGDVNGDGGFGRDIAFDDAGNFVIVGGVSTSTFTTTPGAYDTDYGGPGAPQVGNFGAMDAFASKFDSSGTLLWSTYLGGPSYDRAYAVEFADNGDVIVAGRAGTDFPTTPGALQENFAGDNDVNPGYGPQDGFVTRISADGSELVWSSYFGAGGGGFIRDVEVDASGRILVALARVAGNFGFAPQVVGPRGSLAGPRDAYYGKLSADGQELLFGTYIGGTDGESTDGSNPSIRADGDAVYFVTFTRSNAVDCITPGAYQASNAGDADMMLARFEADDLLSFCTYYGGSGFEGMETHDLAVDASGNAYIAGGSNSADLPTTMGAAQTSRLHDADGFVAKFSSQGDLLAATYVGMASAVDDIMSMNIEGLAVAPNGDVLGGGSDRPNNNSIRHAVVSRLRGDLSEILYIETYGGSGRDELRGVDVTPSGVVGYVGHTSSADWPTLAAHDSTYHSNPDPAPAFVILGLQDG